MADATLAKLKVQIEADNAKLRAELVKTQRQVQSFGQNVRRNVRQVTSSLKGLAGAFVSFQTIKFITTEIAGFERTMSEVKAVTQSTEKQMAAMTKTARQLGATTQFSARQAAEGMAFLGRAGFETSEIIAAMPGLLDLAAAGALELGRAADIASNVLSGFQLAAEESNMVADVLAATAAGANTDIEQLGEAMKMVAPVAAAFGRSIDETAAAIGVLGNAGLQGSLAGTGLRKVMSALANATPQAKDALASLGVTMGEVNPSTNSLVDIVRTLSDAGLDAASALTIFGDRGGPAILALTSQLDELERFTTQMRDVDGVANDMATTMSDNLSGDFKLLQSAVSELALSAGDAGLLGVLRDLTQGFTEMVTAVNNAEDPISVLGRRIGEWVAEIQMADEDIVKVRQNTIEELEEENRKLYWTLYKNPLRPTFSDEQTADQMAQYEANVKRIAMLRDRQFGTLSSRAGDVPSWLPESVLAGTDSEMMGPPRELANAIEQVAEQAEKARSEFDLINEAVIKATQSINDMGKTLEDKIKEARAEINAGSGETLISGTLLQVKRDLDMASTLGDEGETEAAIKKAEAAVELTRQLAEQGKISDQYANALLDRAGEVGGDIKEAAIQVAVDKERAKQGISDLNAEVEAASMENPTKQYIEWVSINTPTAPTLPEGASRANGSPIQLNFPSGNYEAEMTGEDMDAIREEFWRQQSELASSK